MNSLDTYYICTKCENIEKDSNWKKDESNSYTCIKCGAIEKKDIWPSKEIETMLSFILEYDDRATEYGQITAVFLSSVLELFLENLLYTVAYFDLSYDDAGILVDAYSGKNRMISLFKKIGYGSFSDSIVTCPCYIY